MGYPDQFQGFMIESQADDKWSTFKKQEVRDLSRVRCDEIPN